MARSLGTQPGRPWPATLAAVLLTFAAFGGAWIALPPDRFAVVHCPYIELLAKCSERALVATPKHTVAGAGVVLVLVASKNVWA